MADTGWSLGAVVGGTSVGLLVAGLVSPQVGRVIDRHGGRPVLAASSLLHAPGLPASDWRRRCRSISCLGGGRPRHGHRALRRGVRGTRPALRQEARTPITNLTLFGGFASTVCWPLSALPDRGAGWRAACLIYAGLHLAVALPLQMAVMRGRRSVAARARRPPTRHARNRRAAAHENRIFVLLALVLSIAAGIGSIVVVHLMIFLQARGVDFAAAVGLGTLFGPAQVGARVVERAVRRPLSSDLDDGRVLRPDGGRTRDAARPL